MRTIRLGLSSILLIVLLITSAILGGILVSNEIRTAGIQPAWTFTSLDPLDNHPNSYQAMFSDMNGTLYLKEYLAAYSATVSPHNFIAVSKNGSLLWRSEYFGYSSLEMGKDGNLYYSDATNRSDWEEHMSTLWANNLISLSPDGQVRWIYHITNWTISFCGAFSDGAVIAMHNGYTQNETTHLYSNYVSELLCISPTGQLQWTRTMSKTNGTFFLNSPKVLANDTLIMFGLDSGRSIEIGMDKEGNEIWNFTTRAYFLGVYNDYGPLFYGVTKYIVNGTDANSLNETGTTVSIIRMEAFDSRNGSYAWRGLMQITGNPYNQPLGIWDSWSAFVDGKGNIYGQDANIRKYHAFNATGKPLWTKEFAGWVVSTSINGGMFFMNNSLLSKIDANGNMLWQYDVPSNGAQPYSVFVGLNDSLYTIGPNSVIALEHSSFSNNLIWLTILVGLDLIIVVAFFFSRRRATIE